MADSIDHQEWAFNQFSKILSNRVILVSMKLSSAYLASITRLLAIILDGSHLSRRLIIIMSQNSLCWPPADFLLEKKEEEVAIRQNSLY